MEKTFKKLSEIKEKAANALKRLFGRTEKATNTDQEEMPFQTLLPYDSLENDSIYIKALDWALKKDKVYNIAVSGPYGSGKSSIIESYLKNNYTERDEKKEVLRISLASFEKQIVNKKKQLDNKEKGIKPNKCYNTQRAEIERKIVEKILYRSGHNEIPESRFRKLHMIRNRKIVVSVLLLLFFCCALYFLNNFRDIYFSFQRNVLFGAAYWRVPRFAWYIAYGVLLVALGVILFLTIRTIWRTVKTWEISLLGSVALSNEEKCREHVFDEYLDEIILFFERKKIRLVIIEDLDRFDELGVFMTLRELNDLLNDNTNRYIKKPIRFIYALKDDLFMKDTDRAKFFDFIISVVPHVGRDNAFNIITEEFNKSYCNDEEKNSNIKEVIKLVSPYIKDMRIIKCILNDYLIFKNETYNKADDLKIEEMFSLIALKNCYPNLFPVPSESKIIEEVFECIRNYKERVIKEKEEFIKKLEEENEKSYERYLNCDEMREVKNKIIEKVENDNLAVKSIAFMVNKDNKVSYVREEFLNEQIDLLTLENYEIRIRASKGGSHIITCVESSFKNMVSESVLLKLYDRKKARDKEQKENVEKKKEAIKDLSNYRKTSVAEVLNSTDNIKDIFKDRAELIDQKMLLLLLKKGYVEKNYPMYLNYHGNNALLLGESQFLLTIRNSEGITQYGVELANPMNLIHNMVKDDFKCIEALNKSLLFYMLNNPTNEEVKKYLPTYVEFICSSKKECMLFLGENIKEYVEDELKGEGALLTYITKHEVKSENEISPSMLKRLYEYVYYNKELTGDEIKEYEKKDLLYNCQNYGFDLSSLVDIFEKRHKKFKKTLFADVENDVFNKIYKDDMYELNLEMICEVIKHIAPDKLEMAKQQNYTTILRGHKENPEKWDNLYKYIIDEVKNLESDEERKEYEKYEYIGKDTDVIEEVVDLTSIENPTHILKNYINDVVCSVNNYESKEAIIDLIINSYYNDYYSCRMIYFHNAVYFEKDIEKFVNGADLLHLKDHEEKMNMIIRMQIIYQYMKKQGKLSLTNKEQDNINLDLAVKAIMIEKEDITSLEMDAIVASTNKKLEPKGTLSEQIFKKAGFDDMKNACEKIGECDKGKAVITSGFALAAKHVIHVVTPKWKDGENNQYEKLSTAYQNALQCAKDKKLHTIAFPLLGSGKLGWSQDKAWDVAIDACLRFLINNDEYTMSIIFTVQDDETRIMGEKRKKAGRKVFKKAIDLHYEMMESNPVS